MPNQRADKREDAIPRHVYKLADFGTAKAGGTAHNMTGQIIGTMAYLSPERRSGAPASVADNLYAVGIVGYEALTGRHPFGPDENIGALTKSILFDSGADTGARPDVDPQWAAAIERTTSRNPDLRFASVDEMHAALSGQLPLAAPAGSSNQGVRLAFRNNDIHPAYTNSTAAGR